MQPLCLPISSYYRVIHAMQYAVLLVRNSFSNIFRLVITSLLSLLKDHNVSLSPGLIKRMNVVRKRFYSTRNG